MARTALVLLLVAACHDVTTQPIRFQVDDAVDPSCPLHSCDQITLDCIHSVRATLTPAGGSAVVGPCVVATSTPTTLCKPTLLFPSPLFSQLDEQAATLTVEGFGNGPGTPGCHPEDSVFIASTPMPFDLAQAAAQSAPVAMTARCTTTHLCTPVLNLTGHVLNWPPTLDGAPPMIPGPGLPDYNIEFGYTLASGLAFTRLLTANYNPIMNSLSGRGTYPTEVQSDAVRCVGYEVTLLPPGNTISTVRCVNKSRLTGTAQNLDAYFLAPTLAQKAVQQFNIDDGLLLGQVRHNAVSAGNAQVTVQTLDGADASARLYYLTDSGIFVPAASATGTSSQGVFAVVGVRDETTSGASLVTVSATYMGLGSPTQTRVIIPRTASVFEIDL
jgi:hypothetical protein